jgi:signal recognition particle subunit SRP72
MINEQNVYLKDHPNDLATHAVLAALYSSTSSPSASRHTSHLPSISSLTSLVNVAALEAQGIPTSTTTVPKRKPAKKTRKRKARGGKDYDPSKEMDPERWLPLRERSYYKPVKSKKRKTGGATQGGVNVEGEMINTPGGQLEVKKSDPKKKKKGRR